MQMQVYKPTAKNSGSAASFTLSNKDDANYIFVQIIKQASWDNQTKKGSFKANVGKIGGSKSIKLNQAEMAGMLRVLDIDVYKTYEEDEELPTFDTFHTSEGRKTAITFKPYTIEGKIAGYGLRVTETSAEDKPSFPLSLSLSEAYLLKVFLELALKKIFESFQYGSNTEEQS